MPRHKRQLHLAHLSLIWLTGRTRYVSTGIDDKNLFAVPYRARNSTKFALNGADGDS